MNINLKSKLLSKIHKGENIIKYKRSYKHPLLNKRYFNDNFSYFTIKKIWNVKTKSDCCWFDYEKDKSIKWEWKVEIINDTGRYILKLGDLFTMGLYDDKGKKVSDENAFIFYK